MNKLKRKIKYFFLRKNNNSKLFKLLISINTLLFHRDNKIVKASFGEMNPNKTIYVIVKNNDEEGLISMLFNCLNKMSYAIDQGYYPYVLFKDKVQYKMDYVINKSLNPWEYYFKQNGDLTYAEVYESKNVIIDSTETKDPRYLFFDTFNFDDNKCDVEKKFIKDNLILQDNVNDLLTQEYSKINGKRTLGVFLRGTDYTSLKPKGHPKQPDLKTVIEKLKFIIQKEEIELIYLVTEDATIYKHIKEECKVELYTTSENFIHGYDKQEYLSNELKQKNNMYEIGLIYLVRLYILSKCNYIIMSKTNGSKLSFLLNENKSNMFIFDCGYYE